MSSSSYPALTPDAAMQMLQYANNPSTMSKPTSFRPILQILQCKAILQQGGVGPNGQQQPITANNNADKRYRMVLSDGVHFVQCMMGTTANYPVSFFDDTIEIQGLMEVIDFIANKVGNRTIFILLNVRLAHGNIGHRIGQPSDVETAASMAVAGGDVNNNSSSMYGAPPPQPLYNSTNVALVTPPAAVMSGGSTYKPDRPRSSNPYGGSHHHHSNAPSTSTSNAPIVRSAPGTIQSNITPIPALNMYNNRWTIQARITTKSDVRTWSNARGEGSLFSIDVLDSTGHDIRATFFKEAVDKFYPMLDVNKVYTFTGGRLKVANMQYNTCKSNFEITFDQNAEIHLCADTGVIIKQQYEFMKISDIGNVDADKTVDVLAIVKSHGTPTSIVSKKKGQELIKCDIILIDDSLVEINYTVWGKQAERAAQDFQGQPVVAIRRARVSDYGGKSLTSGSGGSMSINPPVADIPEAQALMQWWQQNQHNVGSGIATRSLSTGGSSSGRVESIHERKDIASIKGEGLGYNDKPDWLSVKGYCTFIKKDKEGGAWYPACANAGEPCKNLYKVTQGTDGQWYCEKCNGYYPKPVRRWIFTGVIEDHTSSTWVSFFNEQAQTLLGGLSADEAYEKSYESGPDGSGGFDQDIYDSIFIKASYQEYVFKCKVKNEIVQEENRIKTSVYSLHPIDYIKESIDMLSVLEK